jgi:hypothetical protein
MSDKTPPGETPRQPEGHNRDSVSHVPNQLIVKLKGQFAADKTIRQQVLASLPDNITIDRDFDESGLAVINLPSVADTLAIAKKMSAHDSVEYAEPNFLDSGTTK